MSTLLYRLGKLAFRARGRVLLVWLVILGAVGVAIALNPPQTSTEFRLDGTPSQEVLDQLTEEMPDASGSQASIVFVAPDGTRVDDPEAAAAIADAVAQINSSDIVAPPAQQEAPADPSQMTPEQLEQAQAAAEAMTPVGDLQLLPLMLDETTAVPGVIISEDGSVAMLSVQLTEQAMDLPEGATDGIVEAAESAEDAGLTVLPSSSLTTTFEVPIGTNEIFGLLIAAVVLIITLGSLVVAGLPLVTALVGVGVGVGTAYALSSVIDMMSMTPILALMIGLAVGIDYALFIVNRQRRLILDQGLSAHEAAGRALGTAGSAVFFAGLTVIVALTGLSVVGISFLTTMALIAAATVLVAVLVALTLLPAILGFVGERVVSAKQREKAVGHRHAERTTFATRWASGIARHKVLVTIGTVVALGAIAVPFGSMNLNLPTAATANFDTVERQSYDAITEGFGEGFNSPLLVVASSENGEPIDVATIGTLKEDLFALDDVSAVMPTGLSEDGATATLTVVPESGPNDAATRDLVEAIRALDATDGVELGVTGEAAINIDISQVLSDALVPYLVVIVVLSLLILLLVFRSVFVPVTATLGFVLSIGATLGATTAVFQWGWARELFGFDTPGPLLSFLPIIVTGILYGLAMDYQMFLVSSMRESHVHGHPGVKGVVHGYAMASRVVVAAAIIMISVFAGFIFSHDAMIKQIGFALAIGILFDAFVVRMMLIPAVMSIAGEKAWWLPRWLGRILPNLDVEGDRLVRSLEAADRGRHAAAGDDERELAKV
ncbi:MMPL domain protein [Beutenbergia cavernae DSM 12333]|uniref:MMPL domain protein n=1 Tax=Beutenbergia cavernae (strain ATCC BAA-8 / DSM 12333 / CCUG 43141 / JCM 11478 / NBRC 16432 / NCIMB 13614 / HKI 0122) TaxID=471853 RepID=C5BVU1_BEUC1|nr:MMPL family transporter [Beutenbergia cavernae]ACQ78531.1 MMPL domain protein [Beutenbergia cavernae DSM 12333]